MVERACGLRFEREPPEAIVVCRERRGYDLEGDVAVETGVSRLVDLAHPPRAERREDFVRTDTAASGERHTPF